MDIHTYAGTDSGGRDHNEDYYGYFCGNGDGVWVIADGLGGHACGEVASRFVTEAMIAMAENLPEFTDESLIQTALEANRRLLGQQTAYPELKGMKTTLAAVFTKDGLLKILHAGDSRFYYFMNGSLAFCTRDHSVPQLAVDAGEISFHEIRFHEDRNKVLKVMGLENLNLTNAVDTIIMEPGGAFLLCTDGFWEYVYESEMEADLLLAADPRAWYERMRARLLSRSPEGNDNYSAICCFIKPS